MSLVVVERQTVRSKTGRQMVESSRGWMQQPETSDGRQILDDVLVRVAGMMLTNADGGSQVRPPPSPLLAVPNVTAHPSTASVPITVLLYNGPLLCGFNVPFNG